MYFQIQSIPTPILFVRRQQGDLNEDSRAAYLLTDFVAVTAHQTTEAEESNPAATLALQSMLVNGKQPITSTEDSAPAGNYALQTMVAVIADTLTQTDDPTSNYALQSFVTVTAQVRSETENTEPFANYALQSMTVP